MTTVMESYHGKRLEFTAWHIAPQKRMEPFCQPGDTGSWALDMEGDWVGLIFGEVDGAGLMLPVDKLVADIERFTQAKVELP
jgi:hypothetical protein